MTSREVEAFTRAAQDQAQKAENTQAAEDAEAAGSLIREEAMKQLTAAGYDPSTAERYASVLEAGFSTLAQRSGQEATDLWQRYSPSIQRIIPGLQVQDVGADLLEPSSDSRGPRSAAGRYSRAAVERALRSRPEFAETARKAFDERGALRGENIELPLSVFNEVPFDAGSLVQSEPLFQGCFYH